MPSAQNEERLPLKKRHHRHIETKNDGRLCLSPQNGPRCLMEDIKKPLNRRNSTGQQSRARRTDTSLTATACLESIVCDSKKKSKSKSKRTGHHGGCRRPSKKLKTGE